MSKEVKALDLEAVKQLAEIKKKKVLNGEIVRK